MPVGALNGEALSVSPPFRVFKRCVFTEKSVSSELLVGQRFKVSCKRFAKAFETGTQVVRKMGVAREELMSRQLPTYLAAGASQVARKSAKVPCTAIGGSAYVAILHFHWKPRDTRSGPFRRKGGISTIYR